MRKEREKKPSKDIYKERIKNVMKDRVMSPREVAQELGVNMENGEYFGKFLTAFGSLQGGGNTENFKTAKLQLAKRVSDGEYVYYRKEDEENLIERGSLGPEYTAHSLNYKYRGEDILDLLG